MKGDCVRQGDVLLIRTTKRSITAAHKPVDRDSSGRVVLAYGEVTGHAHVLHDPGVCLLRAEGISDRVLTVERLCELTHEEHASIPVGPGTYLVRTQREWAGEEVRNVAD